MYAPLLIVYCKRGQLEHAVNVWLLLSKQDLQVTEREYASLIKCATRCGNRCLVERVLSDLAEDVLVPSCGTCQAVAEWFQSPAAAAAAATLDTTTSAQESSGNINSSSHQTDNDSTAIQDLLMQIRIPQQSFSSPSMGPVHTPNGWTISNSCSIDTRTGILQSGCLKGERLKPVEISPELWKEMMDANETIVLHGGLQQHASQFQGGKKGKKRRDDDMADRPRHWQQFQDFLTAYTKRSNNNNNKIDIVIDGANVGYYRRSFPDAPKHVDYAQIDWIVEHFQKHNKTVLLFLHSRHFARSLMPPEFEVRISCAAFLGNAVSVYFYCKTLIIFLSFVFSHYSHSFKNG
jgi:ribonuclease P protein 3